MYSAPYLTLTAGDKGIKCLSESPKQCRKGPLGAPPFATMEILSSSHATAHRWLHSLLPRAPGEAPRTTRWRMSWSAGTKWGFPAACSLPRPSSCRVWKLVARRFLPGRRARRGKLSWYVLSGLPGKLLLPGSWFEYFVLEWSSREPRRVLAVTRQALPRGAATARARVRGNRVPLL